MVANQTRLTAKQVDHHLRQALAEMQDAKRKAVLWFSEIVRRRLYRELGYSSVYQYAECELGFKKGKTAQFLRLSHSLRQLPALRRTLARGELSWTKAREVAKVATPGTEKQWIREAKQASSRELETRVTATRKRAAEAVSPDRGQISLDDAAPATAVGLHTVPEAPGTAAEAARVAPEPTGAEASRVVPEPTGAEASRQSHPPVLPVPMDLNLRMTAEQYARYQALLQALLRHDRRGKRASRTELILAGLEQLALNLETETRKMKRTGGTDPHEHRGGERAPGNLREPDTETSGLKSEAIDPQRVKPEKFTRVNSRSPYQVIVQRCPDCESGTVATNRGDKKLTPQELRTILCDASVREAGNRNRAAVPERLRRAVLERDRFRCRSAGCGGTGFLAVHHLVPRENGGANRLENLITLCSGCHRTLHAG